MILLAWFCVTISTNSAMRRHSLFLDSGNVHGFRHWSILYLILTEPSTVPSWLPPCYIAKTLRMLCDSWVIERRINQRNLDHQYLNLGCTVVDRNRTF
ncbi:uncharacterized protein B0T23DRAFT_78825 [Neurospora hispaniola]|uniref:Secreted protein n=1 Tax=Neurospora hispaniola TaxID=588809 RepID=A0AAJ0ID04_9PEZI|nr:hypothetical protein B0T23DRAFT_78825 [Neurospora hispaniola]